MSKILEKARELWAAVKAAGKRVNEWAKAASGGGGGPADPTK